VAEKVLLSLVYRLVRCLFGLLAVLARSDLSKDAELLVLRTLTLRASGARESSASQRHP
jgi:hypothetical protein